MDFSSIACDSSFFLLCSLLSLIVVHYARDWSCTCLCIKVLWLYIFTICLLFWQSIDLPVFIVLHNHTSSATQNSDTFLCQVMWCCSLFLHVPQEHNTLLMMRALLREYT